MNKTLVTLADEHLRTPLAALVGLADTLALTRPEPSPQQREVVDAIRASALRMSELVANLPHMARLESGPVEPGSRATRS